MSDLKSKYQDLLHWLECGMPYKDRPSNPNEHVFILAMYWADVEPMLQKVERLTDENRILELKRRALWKYAVDTLVGMGETLGGAECLVDAVMDNAVSPASTGTKQ